MRGRSKISQGLEGPALVVGLIALLVIGIALSYGGWLVSRWVNWKFGYGPMVEERLSQIESRLDALEAKQ